MRNAQAALFILLYVVIWYVMPAMNAYFCTLRVCPPQLLLPLAPSPCIPSALTCFYIFHNRLHYLSASCFLTLSYSAGWAKITKLLIRCPRTTRCTHPRARACPSWVNFVIARTDRSGFERPILDRSTETFAEQPASLLGDLRETQGSPVKPHLG